MTENNSKLVILKNEAINGNFGWNKISLFSRASENAVYVVKHLVKVQYLPTKYSLICTPYIM